ncbi:MAG: CehA/McbA family metallohydrolase [Planctomycetota bacterium]|nr:CehA/McbA family metallohydrolase [Planctomycetota bacterium]
MRSLFVSLLAVAISVAAAMANLQVGVGKTCQLQVQILGESGQPIPAVVRFQNANGRTLKVAELISRGVGLEDDLPIQDWFALPESATVTVPRGEVNVSAFSGLESEMASLKIDETGAKAIATIRLKTFWDRTKDQLVSGNTHLHVMKLSRQECDRYLAEIPKADDLDVLFLSYLERADADRTYISNEYNKGDLDDLTAKTGVVFGNGEEHRHNFAGFGAGYGHVMLLNIKELIQPVSIGPGIMKTGHDGIPLTRGIQQAKRDGATTIWCHNVFGVESEANWLLGRLDAMNIFDGGQRAGFDERFYQLLNVGLKVPFSTGTDWFMYDLSRVYVPVKDKVTVESWLESLAAGRSFITNGPLFSFRVDNSEIGDTVKLRKPGEVMIHGEIRGRTDFKQLELIQNGEVYAFKKTTRDGDHFVAEMHIPVPFSGSGWLAIRIPPPDLKGDSTPKNEFGRKLYGHTSPIYVEVAGRNRFDPKVARGLIEQMKMAQTMINENGRFEDDQARSQVLDVYQDATEKLKSQLGD